MSDLSLTKARWTTVAFGDVVRQVKDKVDPEESGLERYIGGEHMDTDCLRIRRWGEIGDDYLGPAFHMRFKPGHVLYGSRRTYLRKVALAEFEGITANTTFVLESKDPETLLPELLPFIMQSESFHAHSKRESKGSVNPYVNFSDLAWYKFALPPISEQRQIAEVLQAAEAYQNSLYCVLQSAISTRDSLVEQRMRGLDTGKLAQHERVGHYRGDWPLAPLGDLLTSVQYGLSDSLNSSGRYPVLRMMNLEDGKATADDLKYLDLSDSEFETYRLVSGDVLFNRTNSYELVGRTGIYDLRGDHVFASYLVRLKTKMDYLLPEYLGAFLRAPIGRRQVMSFATRGVSQTNVNAANLKRILIPIPPIDYQKEVVGMIGAIEGAQREIKTRLHETGSLAAKIINGGLAI